ncbi:MAG: hypothetical protein Q7U37_03125 [Gallionella sp.]|nr:hypothetical protein [Gallionella sp.]
MQALQVNDSGAWRTVFKGSAVQMIDAGDSVMNIARIAGKGYKWRVIDLPLNEVIGYCHAPDYTWLPPAHPINRMPS